MKEKSNQRVYSLEERKMNTELFSVVVEGNTARAKFLINNGVDLTLRDIFGFSPLDFAKFYGHTEIVELLKQAGAKKNMV